jgi:hypothetical protein
LSNIYPVGISKWRSKALLMLVSTIVACCSSISVSQAQITIFNVPSTDITPKGQIWQENEAQFRPYKPDAYYVGTHYTAIGLGCNSELDITNLNISSPYSRNIGLGVGGRTVIPILKKRFEKEELKFMVGELIPITFGGNGVGSWTYIMGSMRLPKVRTRLTGGLSLGTKHLFGRNIACFAGGIEHPVTDKLTLQMDWFSGREHALGFLIPGFSYNLPKGLILFAGYQIPNHPSNGRSGFCLEVARYFKPRW